jgi:hypothetical protein
MATGDDKYFFLLIYIYLFLKMDSNIYNINVMKIDEKARGSLYSELVLYRYISYFDYIDFKKKKIRTEAIL